MHCPRCGHEIVGRELKFCPGCGFELAGVARLLEQDGQPLTLTDAIGAKVLVTRRDGIKLSFLWFIVLTFVATPILAILGGDELVALTAVLGTMGALAMGALSLMFLPKSGRTLLLDKLKLGGRSMDIHTTNAPASLPESKEAPPLTYTPPKRGEWKDVQYAEPGSVTEGTTKLLKDEGE